MQSQSVSCSGLSGSLHGQYPIKFLCPWDSADKDTGMGCPSLLQGIFPSQVSNPSPALQADALPLSHQGSPFNFLKIFLFICCVGSF